MFRQAKENKTKSAICLYQKYINKVGKILKTRGHWPFGKSLFMTLTHVTEPVIN